MRKINRKKLDNKGFTLIELLAVVVILAIVLGLVINSGVLGSVDNSKRTLFLSATQKNAVVLNSWAAEDSLVMDAKEKKLGQEFLSTTMSGEWICLSDNMVINNGGSSTTLVKALGLNNSDIVIGTNFVKETRDSSGIVTADPSCSAIRYDSSKDGYELLLVAAPGGKYYVNGDKGHFAYSSASSINESVE